MDVLNFLLLLLNRMPYAFANPPLDLCMCHLGLPVQLLSLFGDGMNGCIMTGGADVARHTMMPCLPALRNP